MLSGRRKHNLLGLLLAALLVATGVIAVYANANSKDSIDALAKEESKDNDITLEAKDSSAGSLEDEDEDFDASDETTEDAGHQSETAATPDEEEQTRMFSFIYSRMSEDCQADLRKTLEELQAEGATGEGKLNNKLKEECQHEVNEGMRQYVELRTKAQEAGERKTKASANAKTRNGKKSKAKSDATTSYVIIGVFLALSVGGLGALVIYANNQAKQAGYYDKMATRKLSKKKLEKQSRKRQSQGSFVE